MHCAIEGTATTPPATASDGQNWYVGTGATGDWADHAGTIACRQNSDWIYITPKDGMHVLDRSSGQFWLYNGGWNVPTNVAAPTGGSTVDTEARGAIAELISALKSAGILP